MENTKIAILYICTGQYTVFWEEFYKSFQEHFLPNCRKEYYVFTDKDDLCEKENVHLTHIDHLDWPYNTLLRFEFFLKVKTELEKSDYIYFFNANMKCNKVIFEQEFLPDIAKGEKLVAAIHPLYVNVRSRHCPFERDERSLAYVPYTSESKYIMGSLSGGEKEAYLSLILELAFNVQKDLQNGFIAKVHDESHLNAYVTKHSEYQVKYLSPSYIYPMELRPAYQAYILMLDKKLYFDVYKFKKCKKKSLLIRAINKIIRYLHEDLEYIVSLPNR